MLAQFSNVNGLTGGNEVRIGGIEVGSVQSLDVKVDPQSGVQFAQVSFTVDNAHWPLREGTTVAVRPKGVLSNVYVDVEPGSPSAPSLGDQPQFDVNHTSSPVNLDELSNIFDPNVPPRFAGPSGDFEVVNGYLRARLSEPDNQLSDHQGDRAVARAVRRRGRAGAGAERGSREPLSDRSLLLADVRHPRAAPRVIASGPPTPRDTVGIDWRDEAQLELCRSVSPLRTSSTSSTIRATIPTEYYARNDQYPPLDAWVLAAYWSTSARRG